MQTPRWNILMGQISRSIVQKSTNEWSVVAACLLLATTVWLITALSKSYSYGISLPVSFDYDKEAFIAASPLPTRVRLKVTGLGWSLVKHQLGLSKSQLVIKPDFAYKNGMAHVTSRQISISASEQLPDLLVAFALSDSLNLQLHPVLRVRLPLVLDPTSINLKPNYSVTCPITIHPDKIEIKGLAEDLRKLPALYTIKLSSKGQDTDIEEVIPIDVKQYPKLRFAQQDVLVSLSIGKLVSWQHYVKVINQTGMPLSQDSTLVFCQVDERKLKALVPDSFIVVAMSGQGLPWAKLRLQRSPSFVLNAVLMSPKLDLSDIKY